MSLLRSSTSLASKAARRQSASVSAASPSSSRSPSSSATASTPRSSRTQLRTISQKAPRSPLQMSPPSTRSKQVANHLSGTREASSATAPAASKTSPFELAGMMPAPGLPEPHTGGGADGSEPKVMVARKGLVAEIILNRPKALNALDLDMVRGVAGAVRAAGRSDQFSAILLRSSQGSRALCAGGDVAKVVEMVNSEEESENQKSLQFFKEEFKLDFEIASLTETLGAKENPSRPFISVMDGITMGGGVGLSVHAPFRIATEKTVFSMPETGIGYFPDVGVTRVLARLDGKIGTYLGMTGNHISGQEAYLAGLATHFVSSSALESLYESLSRLGFDATPDQIASCIDEFTTDPFRRADGSPGPGPLDNSTFLGELRAVLDIVFSQPSVDSTSSPNSVFGFLRNLSSEKREATPAGDTLKKRLGMEEISEAVREWAAKTLATLENKSPRSLVVTHRLINESARNYDIADAFSSDMRFATVFCDKTLGDDFHAGVTHTLTKDPETGKRRAGRAPWKPSTVKGVDWKLIDKLFFGPWKDAVGEAGKPLSKLRPPFQRLEPPVRRRPVKIGPLGWDPEFNNWHPLPSEAEIEALYHGSHPASGSLQIDLSDEFKAVNEICAMLTGGRMERKGLTYGLDWKVADWRRRRLAKRV